MEIQIQNKQNCQKIKNAFLKKVLQQALRQLNLEDREISILLVNDEQMQELNRQYRRKDTPTDVLAFPQQTDASFFPQQKLLGDIVISIPTARRQAQEMGHPLEKELKILLIHGLLHLLGYDHTQDNDAALMQQKETQLLS